MLMRSALPCQQRGVFLIEALLGILIFSLGVLALVAMQATAISAQSDAQYRMEAAKTADRILSQITVNVDRSNAANLATSLAGFEHQPGGSNCNYSGAASTHAAVTDWATQLTAAGTALPGAAASMQQILVSTAAGTYNRVTVTVCWRAPADNVLRRHTTATYVN
jgi:type IV pilus assembly protein PilV